jgi:subtilisin family serine protease
MNGKLCVAASLVTVLCVVAVAQDRRSEKASERSQQLHLVPDYGSEGLPVLPGSISHTPAHLQGTSDVADDVDSVRGGDENLIDLLVHMSPTLERTAKQRADVKEFCMQCGGYVRYEYKVVMPNVLNLRNFHKDQLEKLRAMPGVIKVEEDVYHPDLVRLDESTPHVRGLQSQLAAASLPYDGTGIRLCVADTGIDMDHIMYSSRIDTAASYDFVNNDNNPDDDEGHGSHVSGIAVGGTGLSVDFGCDGSEPFQGMAPGATLIGSKILNQFGGGTDSDIIAGIDHCADQSPSGGRADVINLSIGTGNFSSGACTHSWAVASNNAVANGVVVIAASGNENNANSMGSPACGTDVIAVGATYKDDYPNCEDGTANFNWGVCTDNSPSRDTIVCFSNESDFLDVSAPGSVIQSASNAAGGSSIVGQSGTSMASPMVAGLAALVLDADPTLTPAQVRQILRDGATDLGPAGFDRAYGWGLIDAINTLNLITPCGNDGDCDDGQFCNGAETCVATSCQAGTPPCGSDPCDEALDACSTLQYEWNMNTNPGWTMEGQWAWGVPTGGGGEHGLVDPTSGATGSNVLGYNLNGDYAGNLPETHLTSTAIDCSSLTGVTLRFQRWLNVEQPTYDHAYVRVSNNGSTWTTIWENGSEVTDSAWGLQEFDISSVADNQSTVYLRWTMGTTDSSWFYSGWNVDDVQLYGVGGGPTCSDGIQNQGEDRIDCGGPCAACQCTSDGACDNGQYCDGFETCDAFGNCQSGSAVNCDDGVACTDDSCNEGTDSCNNTTNDGNCADGQYCNGSETCHATLGCQAGTAVNCDDGVGCTNDSCNEGTDSCDNFTNNGNCDDGQYCNGSETCHATLDCQAGTAVNCDDGVACTDDSCNESTDSCDNTTNDGNCADGLFCNGAETCHATLGCQAGGDPCPGQICDEGTDTCNDCIVDGDCADGVYCNGVETCSGGTCQSGTAVNCDDGVSCTDDSCNEGTDSCDNTPNDSNCDDSQYCNGSETCHATLDCQSGTAVNCDDGVSCTDDSCNEGTDSCDNSPNDGLCDDGLFCNGEESCNGSNCVVGSDPCPGQFCDEGTDSCIDCVVDGDCDDGQYCNGAETCSGGTCQSGTAVSCDDGVACTDDSCNEGTDSCDNTANDGNCDDGQYCNGSETCHATLDCQSGTAVNCDDGVACTDDSCNEGTDSCDNTPNDGLCDDGVFCNGAESCNGSTCVGGSDPCPGQFCDEGSDSCIDCLVDGDCDDGLFCNGAETCSGGSCQVGGDPCPGQGCDEGADQCLAGPTAQLESDTVVAGGSAVTVNLANSYINPVVVCSAQYNNNSIPVVARVSNVTSSSFDVRLVNPSGAAISAEVIHYLVVEEGTWTIDGVDIEAQSYLSTVTDENNSWVGEARSYNQPYTAPVVLGQVMTENDADWSVFWNQGSARTNPPDAANLVTGKEVAEDTVVARADETVGFIVIESGSGTISGVAYEAALGADTVAGIDNAPPYSYTFGSAFSSAPDVAVVTMAAMDGGNGGWAQTHGATAASATSIFVSVDEDQIGDSERSHTTEQVGYIVFESAVAYPAAPDCVVPIDCDDGLYCNGAEDCVAGTCVGGSAVNCDDGVACTDDSCNEGTDSCDNVANDSNCDNGQYCDGAETCDSVAGCLAGTAINCDDGVACTDDSCNEGTDSCDNATNDGNCDDGTFCNGAETCDAGAGCLAGSDPCGGGPCDEVNDICPECLVDGDCDDGAYCNGTEFCDGLGVCQNGSAISCDDGVACTDDSCNEGTDSCDNTTNDGNCDDGQYCNGSETCHATLDCQAGSAINCDDGVACTDDSCNEGTDSCDNATNDGNCDDGAFCNGAETCDAGAGCLAGSDPCGGGPCDEVNDVCPECLVDGDCDDGAYCNGTEFCDGLGVCQNGSAINCDDGVGCTNDSCNEGTDSCDNVANDGNCDDGQYCNGSETCDSVSDCQAGTTVNCDDGVACTDDSCNEGTDSCDNTTNDANCADGLFCNGVETCDAIAGCLAGSDPCGGAGCDEGTDSCLGGTTVWMSFRSNTTLPGVGTIADEDIATYDVDSDTWTWVFDGSDVGVAGLEIDGLAVLPSGDLLLSFTAAGTIPGLTGGPSGESVDDSDIVLFSGTLGSSTSGSFSFYFDGSDVAMTSNGEDVDAIALHSDGRLIISSSGSFSGTGASGADEDLFLFTHSSLGSVTSGSFTQYFDGSDVAMNNSSGEDMDAAGFGSSGNLFFSTVGSFSVSGASGEDEDVTEFSGSYGTSTSGSFSLYLDLSTLGISPNEDIGSLHIDD